MTCPGVPDSSSTRAPRGRTRPRNDEQAKKLAAMFVENFKTFEKTSIRRQRPPVRRCR